MSFGLGALLGFELQASRALSFSLRTLLFGIGRMLYLLYMVIPFIGIPFYALLADVSLTLMRII